MIEVYGLKNCDTTRLLIKELNTAQARFKFIDLREQPVNDDVLKMWLQSSNGKKLLNRQSTTWRGLSASEQGLAVNDAGIMDLLKKFPALIKRPVVMHESKVVAIGYSKALADMLSNLD